MDPHGEIALLDKKMVGVLRSLKEVAPHTTCKVSLGTDEEQGDPEVAGMEPASGLPLEIEIHGPGDRSSEIGALLSDAGMYLQEPVVLDQGVIYCNPHFLSWDEHSATPQLIASEDGTEVDFESRIKAILDSPSPVLEDPDLEQDPHILTQLRRYLKS